MEFIYHASLLVNKPAPSSVWQSVSCAWKCTSSSWPQWMHKKQEKTMFRYKVLLVHFLANYRRDLGTWNCRYSWWEVKNISVRISWQHPFAHLYPNTHLWPLYPDKQLLNRERRSFHGQMTGQERLQNIHAHSLKVFINTGVAVWE